MKVYSINSANNSAQKKSQSPAFTAWHFKTSKMPLIMRPCDPEKYSLNVNLAINKIKKQLDTLTDGYDLAIHHKDKGSYEFEELEMTIRKTVPPKDTIKGILKDKIRPFQDTSIPYAHLGDSDLGQQMIKAIKEIKTKLNNDTRTTFLDNLFH